jgi:predicted nucleic acid-binding protein
MELAIRFGITGRHVYDLQIALAARDHGATEIWTNDRAFSTVPGLTLVNPLAGKG